MDEANHPVHEFEQFVIRDTRFALNGADGSWDSATLEVAGATHASQRDIQAVFNDDTGRSVYLLPLNDRRTSLRTVSWVRDASIERVWPNRVVVRVSERAPVAFVAMGPSKFGLIDEDGVILLRRSGCAVIWCPSSNRFLFERSAPSALLAEGTDVLLGTDSLLTCDGTDRKSVV